ncbi:MULTISPECIES: hypothetical protein [unclassified Bradyrhizobium]|uniref:hypothetical protein n=1 Tax=unclassified Bradyrhizobium TaxID=2631580 RepID=UPI00396483C8
MCLNGLPFSAASAPAGNTASPGNWIVGLEYNYAAFGSQTYQLGGASGNYTFDAKPRDIQWAVVRASYKFDAPLIARY